jgi:hypothetical protein
MPTKFNKPHDMIMRDHAGARWILATQIASFILTTYDAHFKLTLISYAEETNSCVASGNCNISWVNMQ